MLKNFSLLTETVFYNFNRLINTSSNFQRKWFYMKKIRAPQTVIQTFPDDWEHKLGLSINKSKPLEGVENLPEYQQLPENLKEMYTYNFLHHKDLIDYEAHEIAKNLNVDKGLHPLSFKIIKNTVRIRCQKLSLRQQNKAKMMEKGLKYLIRERQRNLRQLSIENSDLTNKICNELDIKIVAKEPRNYEPHNPKVAPIIKEVFVSKSKKMKLFQEDLKAAEKDFYRDKKIQLDEIRKDLEKLNLSIEEVYDEVIKDRQERAMEPIYKDKYGWFEKEKELKEYYAKKEQEKKELRERQQRR